MGVFESGGVFQPKAEHAVHSDVGGPNQKERGKKGPVCIKGKTKRKQRARIRVNQVVDCRADSYVDEITQHEQIRDEKQNKKKQPASMDITVGEDRCEKHQRAFGVKQDLRFCKHTQQITTDRR